MASLKMKYQNRSGGTGWRPSVPLLNSLGESGGFCVNCGEDTDGIAPDGMRYPCPHCGKSKVYGKGSLIAMKVAYRTDAELYSQFVEQHGEIIHAGISYALASDPELSNHVLPDHLDGYVEWTASAMDIYGNEYVIKWHFDATLSREIDDAGNLPWDRPSSVIPV